MTTLHALDLTVAKPVKRKGEKLEKVKKEAKMEKVEVVEVEKVEKKPTEKQLAARERAKAAREAKKLEHDRMVQEEIATKEKEIAAKEAEIAASLAKKEARKVAAAAKRKEKKQVPIVATPKVNENPEPEVRFKPASIKSHSGEVHAPIAQDPRPTPTQLKFEREMEIGYKRIGQAVFGKGYQTSYRRL